MARNITQNSALYGIGSPLTKNLYPAVIARRAPTSSDMGQPSQVWIDEVGNQSYTLTSVAGGAANWAVTSTIPIPLPISKGGTGNTNLVNHRILVVSGTAVTTITSNTIQSFLASNGPNTAPSFQSLPLVCGGIYSSLNILAATSTNATGDGTAYLVPFIVDTGTVGDNPVAGVFTLPASANGLYQNNVTLSLTGVTSSVTRLLVQVVCSSSGTYTIYDGLPNPKADHTLVISESQLLYFGTLGETISVQVSAYGTTKTVSLVGTTDPQCYWGISCATIGV